MTKFAILPACCHHGIGVVAHRTIARGGLIGTYPQGTTTESTSAGKELRGATAAFRRPISPRSAR